MELSEFLASIAANYDSTDDINSPPQKMVRDASKLLAEHAPSKIEIRGRSGMGRSAEIPAVAFLDPDETTDMRRGIYVVYLFSTNPNQFYLTLAQGVTELSEGKSPREAREALMEFASQIRLIMPSDLVKGLDVTISLEGKTNTSRFYESSVILSKPYQTHSLPTEADLKSDLDLFISLLRHVISLRSGKGGTPHGISLEAPCSLKSVADNLLFEVKYLEKLQTLLEDKKQVILYGPPGTGKTYLAKKFAEHFLCDPAKGTWDPNRLQLVQFHPSYSYEDFVEGYRPSVEGSGGMTFKLQDGPLKEFAEQATHRWNIHISYPDQGADEPRFVLIIDEINRANLSKVLGELFYLLEYRDSPIRLQYSRGLFTLPPNFYLIGTMNTADRSIATVDAALRRRFHFYPLFPDRPPIEGLLRRWTTEHNPGFEWLADVVDLVNKEMNDSNAAIGPSHFLKHKLDTELIDLIWDHTVLPYIEDYYVGDRDIRKEFSLDKLRSEVAGGTIEDSPGPTT